MVVANTVDRSVYKCPLAPAAGFNLSKYLLQGSLTGIIHTAKPVEMDGSMLCIRLHFLLMRLKPL